MANESVVDRLAIAGILLGCFILLSLMSVWINNTFANQKNEHKFKIAYQKYVILFVCDCRAIFVLFFFCFVCIAKNKTCAKD